MLDLYVGSESEKIEVAFDTGSDWLVVASEICDCTNANEFDESLSTSYS